MDELSDLSAASLRRLARGLLYDRGRAEDVVQEAWLAALGRPLASEELGGWLAGAVRRLARSARRDERRRQERELRAARPEAQPAVSDVLARVEILRKLLDAVERLDEPYRNAIGLRFFDDLPPREIAKRLGLPVNTVRTHVRRGLERLRRELDGERGRDRQGFLAVLAPFAGKAPWAVRLGLPAEAHVVSNWSGALLVKNKVLLVLVVALVAGVSWIVLRPTSSAVEREASRPLAVLPAVDTEAQPAAETALELDDAGSSQRESLPAPDAASTKTWVVRGHAFLGRGEPFPGLHLVGRVYAGVHTDSKAEGKPALEEHFRADEAGDFSWALAPISDLVTVQVEPEVEGWTTNSTYDVFLPGDPAPQRWTVSVYPLDCTIRGAVRDAKGNPVAGATIRERGAVKERRITTDAHGRYAMQLASQHGEHNLRVCAAGFAQKALLIQADQPGEVHAPDVVLGDELRVRGRVVDEGGAPIAGVEVAPDYPFDLVSTTTDKGGAFELGTLDLAADYLSITAQKEGFVPESKRLAPEERTSDIELRLARGVRVTGRVVGPDRTPLWGAWVSVGYTPWSEPRIEVNTDREGRFELLDVPAGEQYFWLWRTGFAQKRVDVEVPSDAAEFQVEFQLDDDHFVGGIVRDQKGEPLPWVTVYAEGQPRPGPNDIEGFHTRTGPDGRFRIDGLPDVRVLIGAYSDGLARVEQDVSELDRDDLVLTMAPSAGLAGRVVDAASGAPISSFLVRVGFPPPEFQPQEISGFPATWSRGLSFTSADGTWRLEDDFEADEVATITIEAPGYAPSTVDLVRTAVDPDPDGCVVRLVTATLVRGRVVEKATGNPIEGARVRRCTARIPYDALQYTKEPVPEATTDAAGRFELANVPTGTMSLATEHAQWPVALDGPFEVTGSAPVERWIELVQGGSVRGRLLDAAGHGLAGETISLYCLDGAERTHEHESTTVEDGSYSLTGLSSGLYHLRWERRSGLAMAYDLLQLVELGSEEEREIDLEPKGKAAVRGTLDFEGKMPDVVNIMIMPEWKPIPGEDLKKAQWARSGRATFAEKGAFELQGLEAGRYTANAHFSLPDGGMAMGSSGYFEVPEAGTVDVVVEVKKR